MNIISKTEEKNPVGCNWKAIGLVELPISIGVHIMILCATDAGHGVTAFNIWPAIF
jgi:hypothetical protein